MKLKTSRLFLLNQYCNFILLIGLASFSSKALSQSVPGVIESFERILKIQNTQFESYKNQVQPNLQILSNFSGLKDVEIEYDYIKAILFNSDDSLLTLARQNECFFIAALENRLITPHAEETENIYINYKDKNNQLQKAKVPLPVYISEIYKKKCITNKEKSVLYNDSNVRKTVGDFNFAIPKDSASCQKIYQTWLTSLDTAYLCGINNKLRKGSKVEIAFYTENIQLDKRVYLQNLCSSLNNETKFCSSYLKDDVWTKIVNHAQPLYKMSFKCEDMYGKSPLNDQEIKNCASKLNADVNFCVNHGNSKFPSYFPLPNCKEISNALNVSKLQTNYQDCPGLIDNEGITNVHRIVNHFNPSNVISTTAACQGEAFYSLARLTKDTENERQWPLEICYLNRVINKKECVKYIPGTRPEVSNNEIKIISNVIYKYKGGTKDTQCKIVDSKLYNPFRTEFKVGCFILIDLKSCSSLKCDKKVIWDSKVQEDIEFRGEPLFEYYATNYLQDNLSLTSLISEVNKIKVKNILNLTQLRNHLDLGPNSIIHGTGCAEDIMPELYIRRAMNQCSPLPFIIDGYLKDGDQNKVVVRLSTDDLHSPRILYWTRIFNAVTAYQQLQPLKTWTLNGLSK